MFWFKPKLTIDVQAKERVELALQWLLHEFGEEYFLRQQMVLPEDSFFPDQLDTDESVKKLIACVCLSMGVNFESVEIRIFTDRDNFASIYGVDVSEIKQDTTDVCFPATPQCKMQIAIHANELKRPMVLVGTIAHELGHAILSGAGKILAKPDSYEFLTEVLITFLGLGACIRNSAFAFDQWQDHNPPGWRASHLSEETFAYALAACAWMKNDKAEWSRHLSMKIGHHFKSSLNYLNKGGATALEKLRTPGDT